MRRFVLGLTAALLIMGVVSWWSSMGGNHGSATSFANLLPTDSNKRPEAPFLAEQPRARSASEGGLADNTRALPDPVVVSPCHIVPIQEQEVSSAVDGVIKEVLADLGQRVQMNDLLGRLDDRQLRAQVDLLKIKATSTAAELIAQAQHDDFDSKIGMASKLRQREAISDLEYKTYYFQRQRWSQEIQKAREEKATAQKELEKGQLLLELHEIRSGLDGEVTKVYKRSGESVKQSEPLFRLANFDRLRIEGLCKLQQADWIKVGMPALVEPELRGGQLTELPGHTGTVTGLAVSGDGCLLASSSEDRSVLLWNWPQGTRRGLLAQSAEALAVALAGPAKTEGKTGYWLLAGGADGQGRLWFVDEQSTPSAPLFTLAHEAAIRAVAFSPDGSRCATGSDDRRIGIWNTADGRHLYWLQGPEDTPAHNGAVTSLHFTPDGYLVSAGRDNALKVWKLNDAGGELAGTQPGRTGEATQLGVSPDGRRLLFDHGEELRILDRQTFAGLGQLRSPRQDRFRSLALFSPSGQLILAAGGNGRVQLWKVPAPPERIAALRHAFSGLQRGARLPVLPPLADGCHAFAAVLGWTSTLHIGPHKYISREGAPDLSTLWNLGAFEVRHFLVPSPAVVQCAAYARDESVVFTGGTDKVIRVWTVPPRQHWQRRLAARITYVGSQVEPGTDMIRVRAEADNPREPAWRLRPGTHATLRLYPETAQP